jgi:hypothetical protein
MARRCSASRLVAGRPSWHCRRTTRSLLPHVGSG